LPLVHAAGLAHVQLMVCEQVVAQDWLMVHEPQSLCMSVQLKVVAILYEAAC
jgi:hypothetical protein